MSLINVNMQSAYVLQSKFRCLSGLPSDKHVKCKRTLVHLLHLCSWSEAENKKHRRSSEVNICVLGFVFTKLITMYHEHTALEVWNQSLWVFEKIIASNIWLYYTMVFLSAYKNNCLQWLRWSREWTPEDLA